MDLADSDSISTWVLIDLHREEEMKIKKRLGKIEAFQALRIFVERLVVDACGLDSQAITVDSRILILPLHDLILFGLQAQEICQNLKPIQVAHPLFLLSKGVFAWAWSSKPKADW